MRAINDSITLKKKYGAGYRVNLITEEDCTSDIKSQVMKQIPGLIVEDEATGFITIQIPNSSKDYIPKFVSWLESNYKGLKAWGISQTTVLYF